MTQRHHEVGALHLPLLLAVFFVLALLYGVVNPILEAPDEVQHYYYVRHISQTGRLAVQDPDQVALYRQEGSQPPLYYLFGALLTFWIDQNDAEEVIRENPHVNLGVPQAFGNKNAVVHRADEGFPYRGVPLAVHLLRGLSALFGVLTVWGTHGLGRIICPDRPGIALLAAGFNALLPQFLFMSAAVNNDVAVAATACWAAALLARSVRDGFAPGRSVALGALMGLAALSKLSGLVMIPLAVLGLVYRGWRRDQGRAELFRNGLIMGAVAAIIGGWWYARNWTLYSDPLGLHTMLEVVGRREAFSFSDLLFELEGLRLSFWGLFGWFNVLMDRWAYLFYDVLALLGLVGLGILFWRQVRTGSKDSRCVALLVGLILWVGLAFGALLHWTRSTTGSQGRLLFVALPALCVLWAVGLAHLVPRRFSRLAGVGILLVWLMLAALTPFAYIGPAYARPSRVDPDALPPGVERLDVVFADKLRLIGYEMPQRRVRRGTPLPLTLYWQSLAAMDRDYTVFVHLFGRDGEAVGQEDTYPGAGNYPTSQWRPGEVIADRYQVLVLPEARAPALGLVDVGVYDLETQERLQAYDAAMKPVERVVLAPFKIATWAPHRYEIDHRLHYELGSEISLIGYRISDPLLRPGDTLVVALYWEARTVPVDDYTVFVHLTDERGEMVAQHDGPPVNGDYPTSFWDSGEVVKDEHRLDLPAVLSGGTYHVRVGMYRAGDGKRLSVKETGERDAGDYVPLAEVEVQLAL